MIYFSHIRAGLIASALLLTTALASPALAATLPEISPRQIASDVDVRTNPQSGEREFIAPSFDPFEEDRTMAGTASLRSVSNGTTIDGQSLRGGALLDMTFYYNSASNDPYDTRGYEEAVYLSGEYAPVTLRDNRILECNEQVQDVVYYHEDYYRSSLYVNLYRPYRHYSGHYAYGGGYDYGRSYRSNRGYGYVGGVRGNNRNHTRNRTRNRRNALSRAVDRARDQDRASRVSRGDRADRETRRDRNDRGTRDRTRHEERGATERREDRTSTARDANRSERRANRNNRSNHAETRGGTRRIDSNDTSQSRRAVRNRGAAGRTTSDLRATPQRVPRDAAPTPRPQRAEAAAPAPQRAERAAPAPRARNTERSRPARAERITNRASQRLKSRNSPRRSGGRKGLSRGNSKLKLMSFLPMASAWSRNVVRNVDIQCAREEILSVHIPQERLDAARFDGLTVIVLDRAGAEVPVFIPPNYIEGFRQAVSGRVTPSVSYQEPRAPAPVTREPIYQEPRPYGIEEAPCPAGTTKQHDGTCLQGGANTYGGYPTR